MSVFVKICGVRTLEDALACVDAGADAIGFNFWPGSSRYIDPEAVAPIAARLPAEVRKVGVFVDAPLAEVQRLLDGGVIDWAQLHGDEPPEACARLGARALKAIRLRDESSLQLMRRYDCELTLLDADARNYGGSGQRADVALAARAAVERRVLLAGGLTPENVAAAIAAVRPYGVDVAGGVERAPGVKDANLVAAFVARAKEEDRAK
jgi:phosphoribosylanthranilate isomerase